MDVFYAIHIFSIFLIDLWYSFKSRNAHKYSGGGINWRISLGGKKIWRHM